jgi:arginyl-tRNA--protein-N-Asp/Glu arginylyltransferase
MLAADSPISKIRNGDDWTSPPPRARMVGLALELARFTTDESSCEYLPQRQATMEYRLMVGVQPAELDRLLERGWRRFGPAVFRPACGSCGECVSLRIDVQAFHVSRSQRRARNRCAHLTVTIGPPRVDDERLDLHARWHAGREQRRGWQPVPLDAADYARSFGNLDACSREVQYRDEGGKLVGLGICDETATAYSAVYFFHDPGHPRMSLGVNHVLTLIERARREGKRHVYLGYRVLGCFSMRYKAEFRPHELLEGRPSAAEPASWRRG